MSVGQSVGSPAIDTKITLHIMLLEMEMKLLDLSQVAKGFLPLTQCTSFHSSYKFKIVTVLCSWLLSYLASPLLLNTNEDFPTPSSSVCHNFPLPQFPGMIVLRGIRTDIWDGGTQEGRASTARVWAEPLTRLVTFTILEDFYQLFFILFLFFRLGPS